MKLIFTLIFSTLVTTSIAFAESEWSHPSVHCDTIDLSTWGQSSFKLYLSKDGNMEDENMTLLSQFDEFDGKTNDLIENSDATFDVKILKKVLFDDETKHHWGFRPMTIRTKTYAVRVHISSNKVIGHQINGCIPRPIKEVDQEIFCRESIQKSEITPYPEEQ